MMVAHECLPARFDVPLFIAISRFPVLEVMLRLSVSLIATSATLVLAAPTTTSVTSLNDRSTFRVLADGSSYQSGNISPSLRWQSSGLLSVGCSESIGIQASS
ncbi:uncharacterized protein JCM15063_005130 [Sporobolomyces koalae]|uniref:uncharacterized protein n=1 Tax=Sporobolomyces koalae TaxID=500713 RepID=UPI00316EEDB6